MSARLKLLFARVDTASKSKTVRATARTTAAVTASGERQRKGPQPALYLDPKSGATWSGRRRAPARLAGAKDRTKFLIAGAVSATESLKTEAGAKKAVLAKKAAAAKNAAPAKNAVTKKAAAKKSATPVAKKSVAVKTVAKKTPTKKAAVKKLKDQGTATAAPSVDASAQGPDVTTTSMSA